MAQVLKQQAQQHTATWPFQAPPTRNEKRLHSQTTSKFSSATSSSSSYSSSAYSSNSPSSGIFGD
ncbi:hypothetical protein TYRP_008292 [Tyrophagus putrescentiae]|nr:hypothetical protein TYRP_008292 [Tyrophagus putrescentiae]